MIGIELNLGGTEQINSLEADLECAYARGALPASQLVTDDESRARIIEAEAGLDDPFTSHEELIICKIARGLVRGAVILDDASDRIIAQYTHDVRSVEGDEVTTSGINAVLYARLLKDRRVKQVAHSILETLQNN